MEVQNTTDCIEKRPRLGHEQAYTQKLLIGGAISYQRTVFTHMVKG
jgi:hypothetical protein